MARRTTGKARAKGPKVRKDWTYNPLTYVSANISLTAGPGGIAIQPLTFSQTAQRQIAYGAENALAPFGNIYSGAAFPERSSQQVFAVQADIHIEPAAWTAGNFMRFGWRLAVFDMDPIAGGADTLLNYSMFTNAGVMNIYQFANLGFLAEGRMYRIFGDGDAGWQCRVKWSAPRGIRIGNDRALYLVMEAASDSVSLRVRPFARTLQRSP